MTSHFMKAKCPLSDLRTKCGVSFKKAKKGARLVPDSAYTDCDCVGCLQQLIHELKLQAAMPPSATEPTAIDEWIASGDTGISSETIWHVLSGRPFPRHQFRPSTPMDPADFGRCHRLLEKIPAWRARLPEVAVKYPGWSALVGAWDELTALYLEELPTGRGPKLYDRMQALEGAR
jgi:hypothetical protein